MLIIKLPAEAADNPTRAYKEKNKNIKKSNKRNKIK
jgi:hypothetical protein